MDFKFKCKTWVENICTKFENMCEDVEDIVCQEAKYVENHVQTVGANVKIFYSEVVQDFVPPPSKESDCNASPKEDPTKNYPSHEESELIASATKNSSDKSTSNGICTEHTKEDKTPAPRLSEETLPLSSPRSEDYLDALSLGHPAKESGSNESDPSLEESKDSEKCQNSGEGIEEISSTEKPPFPDVAEVACSRKDSSQALLFNHITNEDDKKLDEKLAKMILPDYIEVECHGFIPELDHFPIFIDSAECTADVSSSLPSLGRTDLILSGSSCENKVDDTGLSPSSSILSSPKYDGIETSMKSSSFPLFGSSKWIKHYSGDVEPEAFMSTSKVCEAFTNQSDSDNAELPKFNVGFEPVMDMNEFDDVKLGDSCMEVVPKELFSISSRPRKHRSYRKNIRDAFASRMGPRKQREYEQLAILCGDLDSKADTVRPEGSVPSMLTKRRMLSKNLQGPDLYESDWELV